MKLRVPNGHVSPLRLPVVLLTPVERAADVPAWGKLLALAAAAYSWLRSDMFAGALLLTIVAAAFDYWVGVKAAKHTDTYDPGLAHGGAMSKVSGVLLLLLLRGAEAWALSQVGVADTRGAVATAVAVSLFTVDLQSIAHHRESFGAPPIPVLSKVFAWLHAVAGGKVPASHAAPAAPVIGGEP